MHFRHRSIGIGELDSKCSGGRVYVGGTSQYQYEEVNYYRYYFCVNIAVGVKSLTTAVNKREKQRRVAFESVFPQS